jgi:hypothetical protein
MMSEYISTPCHRNKSKLQCWNQQQISKKTAEHMNMTNNGQKEVEHSTSAKKQENMQTWSPTIPQCHVHAMWDPHICGFQGPLLNINEL